MHFFHKIDELTPTTFEFYSDEEQREGRGNNNIQMSR